MKNEKNISNEVINLLIRFSDINGPIDGTINEHLKVIKNNGFVWFGKFGRRIGIDIIDLINSQINKGVDSYLFLVGTKNADYVFISKILAIVRSSDKINKIGVPQYYREKSIKVGTWVKIGNFWRINKSILSRIYGNFRVPVYEMLSQSMTGHVIVKTQSSFSPEKNGAKKL